MASELRHNHVCEENIRWPRVAPRPFLRFWRNFPKSRNKIPIFSSIS